MGSFRSLSNLFFVLTSFFVSCSGYTLFGEKRESLLLKAEGTIDGLIDGKNFDVVFEFML